MKKEQINIRDPLVLPEGGKFYLYGSRAATFGVRSGGFDVYVSDDLENWSEPIPCFDSEAFGLNRYANWAPEVHKYGDNFYMFATFTKDDGLRGTYSLIADSPLGPFRPHSRGALTPDGWECLDGTLYVDDCGVPYLIFCHEHTQIIDGTVCYVQLSDTLDAPIGDVVTLFAASECEWAKPIEDGHFVTDGPYLYRSVSGELFMIWSSFVEGKNYAEVVVRFKDGRLGTEFSHMPPLLDSDGGHGMIFKAGKDIYFIYHTPNSSLLERPALMKLEDTGDSIRIKA